MGNAMENKTDIGLRYIAKSHEMGATHALAMHLQPPVGIFMEAHPLCGFGGAQLGG